MNLEKAITEAIEATTRFQNALENGDLDLARDLLLVRAKAMTLFEAAHRNAAEDQRSQAIQLLRELKAADDAAKGAAHRELEATMARFRSNLDSTSGTQGTYHKDPSPACLDRKA